MEVVVLSLAITAILLALITVGLHTILYTRQVELHHSMLQVQSEVVRDNAEFGNRMYQLLGRIEGRLTSSNDLPDAHVQELVEAMRRLTTANPGRGQPKSRAGEAAPSQVETKRPSATAAPAPERTVDGNRQGTVIRDAQGQAAEETMPRRPTATVIRVPQPQIVLGKVRVGGQQAPSGTQVQALVDGVELARGSVKAEGFYQLSVPSPSLVGKPEVSALRFAVLVPGDDKEPRFADKQLRWTAGEVTELQLEV